MDGADVIRSIREWSNLPIMVLSVRAREQDKIAALDAGADDYLTNPFAVGELLAQVRVALRHISPTQEAIFQIGELRADLARRLVTVAGNEVKLTPTEYAILKFLVLPAGKVVTHQQLLREVRGTAHPNEAHYVQVFVRQLREKLEENLSHPRHILTETGIGYRIHTDEMN